MLDWNYIHVMAIHIIALFMQGHWMGLDVFDEGFWLGIYLLHTVSVDNVGST